MNTVTQRELKKLLTYNSETGVFTWGVPWGGNPVGGVAGTVRIDGRVRIKIRGKLYYAHRLAWLHIYGTWPKDEIDHRNGNPGDNRIINLREATHRENGKNTKIYTSNVSGFKGVSWHQQNEKWQAAIRVDGDQRYLGCFPTPEAASAAYEAKAAELFGEFRRNRPPGA